MTIFLKKIALTLPVIALVLLASPAEAHRSGCHRWHSCPSDTGSYTCGDAGHPCQYPTYPKSGGVIYPPSGYYKDCYDCVLKKVPSNSHTSGISWSCNIGYYKSGSECLKVIAPANASIIGSSWFCNYGYHQVGQSCVKDAPPIEPSYYRDGYYWPPKSVVDTDKYQVRKNASGQMIFTQVMKTEKMIGNIYRSETDPGVYLMDSAECLKLIPQEGIATRMFGSGWNSYVNRIDDAVFRGYQFCGTIEK